MRTSALIPHKARTMKREAFSWSNSPLARLPLQTNYSRTPDEGLSSPVNECKGPSVKERVSTRWNRAADNSGWAGRASSHRILPHRVALLRLFFRRFGRRDLNLNGVNVVGLCGIDR